MIIIVDVVVVIVVVVVVVFPLSSPSPSLPSPTQTIFVVYNSLSLPIQLLFPPQSSLPLFTVCSLKFFPAIEDISYMYQDENKHCLQHAF